MPTAVGGPSRPNAIAIQTRQRNAALPASPSSSRRATIRPHAIPAPPSRAALAAATQPGRGMQSASVRAAARRRDRLRSGSRYRPHTRCPAAARRSGGRRTARWPRSLRRSGRCRRGCHYRSRQASSRGRSAPRAPAASRQCGQPRCRRGRSPTGRSRLLPDHRHGADTAAQADEQDAVTGATPAKTRASCTPRVALATLPSSVTVTSRLASGTPVSSTNRSR